MSGVEIPNRKAHFLGLVPKRPIIGSAVLCCAIIVADVPFPFVFRFFDVAILRLAGPPI